MQDQTTTETTQAIETIIPVVDTALAETTKPDNSELLKLKSALDKAAKEAADYKKQLRAKQSEEETRLQDETERKEAMETELETLRKKFAVSDHAKRTISLVEDEAISNAIADSLYGATDADAVIDAFSKAWAAKEKKLRIEFGKIPPPATGDGSTSITKEQFTAMTYHERSELQLKSPELYNKLKL